MSEPLGMESAWPCELHGLVGCVACNTNANTLCQSLYSVVQGALIAEPVVRERCRQAAAFIASQEERIARLMLRLETAELEKEIPERELSQIAELVGVKIGIWTGQVTERIAALSAERNAAVEVLRALTDWAYTDESALEAKEQHERNAVVETLPDADKRP